MNLIEIQLSNGDIVTIDDTDSDLLQYKWRANPAPHHRRSYAVRYISTRPIKLEHMHRVILERVINRKLNKNELVDHIDGNGLNNTRGNLRLVSHSQNMKNRKTNYNSATGYKGVHFDKHRGKYRAQIGVEGVQIRLGYFDNPQEAHEAYCEAALKYHKEFARLK